MVSYKQAAADAMARGARKIPRSNLRAYTIKLLKEQGGVCAICGREISLKAMGSNSDYVMDHCHDTGLLRGVLHRGCNGALGKIENNITRWSGVGSDMDAIIEWMRKAVAYYDKGFHPIIYPEHKTKEERELAQKQKARVAAARKRVTARIAKEKQND